MIYWPFFADCDSICAFARVKVGPCVSRARLPQITWCINSARTCVPTRSMITALKEHTEVAQCVGLFAMRLYLGCSRKPKKKQGRQVTGQYQRALVDDASSAGRDRESVAQHPCHARTLPGRFDSPSASRIQAMYM